MSDAARKLARARKMIELIEQALLDNPIGVIMVTVDGVTTQFARKQALDELQMWRKQEAALSGARPRVARVDLQQ